MELRFCPWLLLFKYCTGGQDPSSFLRLHNVYLWCLVVFCRALARPCNAHTLHMLVKLNCREGGHLRSGPGQRTSGFAHVSKMTEETRLCFCPLRGLQRDVVYLGWPIAPSYMSPNAGEGGELRPAGPPPMSSAVHRSQNKLWRYNSIFNLCAHCKTWLRPFLIKV